MLFQLRAIISHNRKFQVYIYIYLNTHTIYVYLICHIKLIHSPGRVFSAPKKVKDNFLCAPKFQIIEVSKIRAPTLEWLRCWSSVNIDPLVWPSRFSFNFWKIFFWLYLEESEKICVLLSPIFLGRFFFWQLNWRPVFFKSVGLKLRERFQSMTL